VKEGENATGSCGKLDCPFFLLRGARKRGGRSTLRALLKAIRVAKREKGESLTVLATKKNGRAEKGHATTKLP